MARNWEVQLPAVAFIPDASAQLVAGDLPCRRGNHKGRPILKFDDTDEEAAVSLGFVVPAGHTGSGTKKADIDFYMASDAANDVAIDLFIEAVTPNSDTLDLETATSWDSANSGTKSLAGTTAGDLQRLTITLTNSDGLLSADFVRVGVRRDCDSANDDAAGDLYIALVTVYEET